ncbi:MAG TPA: hypothetical protein VGJ13_00895 [Pseudonocardiaceae bacterium]|jgi:hypothetical protein
MPILSPAPLLATLFVAVAVIVWWRIALRVLIGCVIIVLIVGLHQVFGQMHLQSSMTPLSETQAEFSRAGLGS